MSRFLAFGLVSSVLLSLQASSQPCQRYLYVQRRCGFLQRRVQASTDCDGREEGEIHFRIEKNEGNGSQQRTPAQPQPQPQPQPGPRRSASSESPSHCLTSISIWRQGPIGAPPRQILVGCVIEAKRFS
eukprot:TRINITY_DN514_c0_g1_i4.p2 TRINITY_DN514_c0_g1~~TRINITY_DN514_c0_g1_i4.p2  ORF type:complete len:129 (-),score=7.74 TRINITY_DN514_c0_g1_i4:140-526(-)